MKHRITADNIRSHQELMCAAFEAVADPEHYKVLYKLQKGKDLFYIAGTRELLKNETLINRCVEYANKPGVYEEMVKLLASNWSKFEELNISIPNREADFKVSRNSVDTYFFIEEKLEIEANLHNIILSRLLEDPIKDTLLFNSLDYGGSWIEYKYDEYDPDNVSSMVAVAYKNYLADQELLT